MASLNPWASKAYEVFLMFRETLTAFPNGVRLPEALDRYAVLLCEAHVTRRVIAEFILQRLGSEQSDSAPSRAVLPMERSRDAIALWHGFTDWSEVLAHGDRSLNLAFESACDAIVLGNVHALRGLVERDPTLVVARSPFAHRCTLLHYLSANCVESHRQWQSPSNRLEVANVLLHAGADPNATCDCYGGGHTVFDLTMGTAAIDADAKADLVELLFKAGAKCTGPHDIWAAITTGNGLTAERLARLGAPVDNMVFAAAIGDIQALEAYFDSGQPRAWASESTERMGRSGPALDPNRMLEYALIFAASNGRRQAVEFLLTKSPDLNATEPLYHGTALGHAKFHNREDVVALLTPLCEKAAIEQE